MLHYGLNKIKLAFDAQYKIVLLTLLTYLLSCVGLENTGLEQIPITKFVSKRVIDQYKYNWSGLLVYGTAAVQYTDI